ncbi:MAG: amidophosphoribosyltransferase [Treponema sp.]|jgi:amidophosphoribosyltransferase|nr:amidophosphoribosyltransferase [Treponema sp.]
MKLLDAAGGNGDSHLPLQDEDSIPHGFYPSDKLREECGVFGVYLEDTEKNAAPLVYFGLLSLQHRGQESAGIAAVKDKNMEVRKGMGLVASVFTPEITEQLKGSAAIGHVRYSTSGACAIENAQPFLSRLKHGSIALAHNGTLTNADVVRELLEDAGISFSSTSDSEVILNLIAKNYRKGIDRALTDTIQSIKGSYALTVLTEDALIGARDPNGIRPLCLGEINGGWVLASESCAISAVGGKFVRDIDPGELVIISKGQVQSYSFTERTRRAVCSFEYVYFARPDSVIDDVDVYNARVRAGEILAKEAPADADIVIGVPDSGVPAAIGYGRAASTPFGLGIVKSKYVARTFISPTQPERERAVLVKHNVIVGEVRGKRIVIIDDSIVRGTTSRRLVSILREAGAKEVHVRICSPPVRFPCYFGIDTPHRKDLISNDTCPEKLCEFLGADSLAFISSDGLLESLRITTSGEIRETGGYCLGCFTGDYPIPVHGELLVNGQ